MWFWFCVLSVFTLLNFIWDLIVCFQVKSRKQIIVRKLKKCRTFNVNIDVTLITEFIDYGDWKLIYHILENMNSQDFSQFCLFLSERLRQEMIL